MYGYHKQADRVANDLARAWMDSTNYINDETASIFRTFKLDGGLTEEEAKQLLNNLPDEAKLTDLKAVIGMIDEPQKKRELLNIINSPAYAWRIERLERLQQDIDAQTSQLAGIELSTTREHYIDLANEAYHRTMFDIQRGTGYGFSFAQMPIKRIMEILDNNWSGKLFSERIWGRASEVNKTIQNALLTGFMTGRSYRKTAKEIEERMAVGAMEARRLVRTESTYVANMAELESYKEGGVDKFRFLATLDMRTSAICASMDGKVFLTKDGVPGVNIPPLHPWCRSTTVPEIDGADLSDMKRRARDPKTGETYLVPADMTYEEWRKSVDNSGKSDIMNTSGISGALNPNGKRGEEHAKRYYGLVRSMKTDVSKIAKTTGFSESKIQEVKDFIFNEKHDLGGAEKEYFMPNYMMAESWQRLINGKPEQHDITLINHEIMERELMKQGYTQSEAHIMASKKYNYDKEATEFYGRIEKYTD